MLTESVGGLIVFMLLDTSIWRMLKTSGDKLKPRGGHTAVSFGKHLLVFGGFSDERDLFDDLHMLDVG